jgi:hypothetical protein
VIRKALALIKVAYDRKTKGRDKRYVLDSTRLDTETT